MKIFISQSKKLLLFCNIFLIDRHQGKLRIICFCFIVDSRNVRLSFLLFPNPALSKKSRLSFVVFFQEINPAAISYFYFTQYKLYVFRLLYLYDNMYVVDISGNRSYQHLSLLLLLHFVFRLFFLAKK